MGIIDILLLITSPLIFVGLIFVFVQRALVQQFPFFFSYAVYSLVATGIRMAFRHPPSTYYWVYWSTDFIYDVLAFLTMMEVFRRIFPPSSPMFRSLRWLLPALVVLLMGLSLYATFHSAATAPLPRIVSGIYWFNIGIHGVEGIFLPLVIVLILVFAVPWPPYEMGILGGFAVSAYSIMLSALLRMQGGHNYEKLYLYGGRIGFTVATVIWFWTFVRETSRDKLALSFARKETFGS